MKIGISIWPETDAEWLELSLGSLPGVSVELIAQRPVLPVQEYQLLIVDAESPGPHFIQQQRQFTGQPGKVPIIFLGDSRSPAIARLPLKGLSPSYLPKPYKIADLRAEVAEQLQVIRAMNRLTPPAASPSRLEVNMSSSENRSGREQTSRHPLNNLSNLRLSDLLQMLCPNLWTGKIEITNLPTGKYGCVYVNCGLLIHAESPGQTAEEACCDLLLWDRCEFHFIEHHAPVVQTVKMHWQMILLEAARRQDEDLAFAS